MQSYLAIHSIMNMFHLLVVFSLPSVDLFDVELTCPQFKDGVNKLICRINKTAVDNAGCLSSPEYVRLDRTVDKITSTPCQAPPPEPSNCKKLNSSGLNSCWCDESYQDIFTYVFFYWANLSQDKGALLECKYCSETEKSLKVNICKNISFEDTPKSEAYMIRGTSSSLAAVFVATIMQL